MRRANAETLTTLDGVERSLDAEDVVIADGTGAISLAGVMGGASTEVDDSTSDVEAASFDPLSRCSRLQPSPQAVERGEQTFRADCGFGAPGCGARSGAQLLVEIAGGRIEPVLTDIGEAARFPSVTMDFDLPDRIAGVQTRPDGTAARRLTQIGCTVRWMSTVAATDNWSSILPRGDPTWCSAPIWSKRCCGSKGSRRSVDFCRPLPVGAASPPRSVGGQSARPLRSPAMSKFFRRCSCPRESSTRGASTRTTRAERRRRC